MATIQQLHLDILNQEYGRFVKDQVLTEVQLNEIIDFFEDQHRLTRTCLVGTGIVCGLHMSHSASSVILRPGVAVTTDGDLLKTVESTYLYFTKYIPPDDSHYDPFYFQAGNTEKMLTLYQLLTEEEKDALNSEDFKPITELDDTIKNWIGILYLEYYTKDPDKCTPTNCDNLGLRQKATPKLLILSKEDTDKLIHKDAGETIGDNIYQKYQTAYDQYFTFPVIKAKRVIPRGVITLKSTTLASAYFTATKDGAGKLGDAIKKLYTAFSFLIDTDGSVNIDALTTKLINILTQPTDTLHAQYTYDFYKDVAAAYNELREILYTMPFECCPNIYAFPKHIMLGEPDIENGQQPPEYRHQFYPSAAVSNTRELADNAASLLVRLKLLIDNFKPQLAEEIRITPSLDYDRQLSERAIPFYYTNIDQMAREWNYAKSLKGHEKLNLSYNADQYSTPVPDHTLNPLNYDIDSNDFFRIEGHIGRTYQDALKELNEVRAVHHVPFDLVSVRLGDVKLSDIDLDDFSCQFEDLNTILRAFQAEINCLLSEGATFFSGFTASATKPHINMHLFIAQPDEQQWNISDDQLRDIRIVNAAPGMKLAADDKEDIHKPFTGSLPKRTVSTSKAPSGRSISDVLTGIDQVFIQRDPCDQFNTPIFTAERVVKTNLNLNQMAFGKFFLQALESDTDSVDTFVEKARNIAISANALGDLNEDERYVVFEYPMQLIGNLNYLQRFIPGSLSAINTNLITNYRNFSEVFCKRLKAMHTRLEKYFKKSDYTARGFETVYLNMLNNLSNLCCANEKLEVIMKEIEKRKVAILEQLSFARYAEKHPGLEHKCGTHRGGTFVMVYAGKKTLSSQSGGSLKAAKDIINADNMKKQAMSIAGSPYRDPDTFALYVAANDDVVDQEAELANFLSFNTIRPGSVAADTLIRELNSKIAKIRLILCRNLTEPEQDVVIADFCLPYLCCSDCPPMAFVIPRERKILALPEATVCSTSEPIAFSLYSPKGSVIGSPEAPQSITQGENPTFDPSKVPNVQIGKTITFTLDGEATSCEVMVRSPLELVLTAELERIDEDAFMVFYKNLTDESQTGKNSYVWTFNDGSSEATQGDDSLVKTFSLKVLAELGIDTITAEVKVLDDPCNSTGTVSIDVPQQLIKSCKDLVLTFISAASTTLTTQEFKRRVASTESRDIQTIYEETLKLLDGAQRVVPNEDNAARDRLLQRFRASHERIYVIELPSTAPKDHRRILEELLRVQLMLMLNLIRCDKDLAERAKGLVLDTLRNFIRAEERLKSKFPQLDNGNVLEKALTEYATNVVSQDDDLITMLKKIIEILGTFT